MRKGSDDGPPWDAHWDTWPRTGPSDTELRPLHPWVRHKEGVRAESGHCTHSHSSAHPASPPTCAGALSRYLVVNVITSLHSAVWLHHHTEHWGVFVRELYAGKTNLWSPVTSDESLTAELVPGYTPNRRQNFQNNWVLGQICSQTEFIKERAIVRLIWLRDSWQEPWCERNCLGMCDTQETWNNTDNER